MGENLFLLTTCIYISTIKLWFNALHAIFSTPKKKSFDFLPICNPFPGFPLEHLRKLLANHAGCLLRRMQYIVPHERVAIIRAIENAYTKNPVTVSSSQYRGKKGRELTITLICTVQRTLDIMASHI